jgi:dipeptidyl-peptidase 4
VSVTNDITLAYTHSKFINYFEGIAMTVKETYVEPGTCVMTEKYRLADIIMQGFRTHKMVQNDRLSPYWIEDSDYFWYERTLCLASGEAGKEYRLVNARDGSNIPAFDHTSLAQALSKAVGETVSADALPIRLVSLQLDPASSALLIVRFSAFEQRWRYSPHNNVCESINESPSTNYDQSVSPDGRLVAYVHDYNLWIRNLASHEEFALTEDGEERYGYAGRPWFAGKRSPIPDLCALWSPDGTRVLFVKRDYRQVKTTPHVRYIPKDGSLRPQLSQLPIAYAGDEHIETYQLMAAEVANGRLCPADYHPVPFGRKDMTGFFNSGRLAWWSADSRRAYFIDQERGDRVVRLVEFDTTSGATRVLFEETAETQINIVISEAVPPLHHVLPKTNEFIWWSERSGWGHLYLYDLNTGELKNTITQGDWLVRSVLHIDEARREAIIQTGGRHADIDPYYRDICRVNIDTGKLNTLLAGDYDYTVHSSEGLEQLIQRITGAYFSPITGVSPSGNYLVASRSRADCAPCHLLLDREGQVVAEFEKANIDGLPKGWQWPEPVKLLAADGKTDIYGLVHRPSDFSEDKNYPVINFVTGTAWIQAVPKASFTAAGAYGDWAYSFCQAMAELGAIVVQIDSRGTPFRSKAFLDVSYGSTPSAANPEDHLGAIQQLATRYPYMDLDRVGVVSQAYPGGLTNFLKRQDFYKACLQLFVIDDRLNPCVAYADKYEGVAGHRPEKQFPEDLVAGLRSKLCLMHSMNTLMSQTYNPAGFFRIVDALQAANKDFEMLVVPDGGFIVSDYQYRRGFDFLVRELMESIPPKEYRWAKSQARLLDN